MNEPMTNERAAVALECFAKFEGCELGIVWACEAGAAALRRVAELERLLEREKVEREVAWANNRILERARQEEMSQRDALRAQLDAIRAEVGDEPSPAFDPHSVEQMRHGLGHYRLRAEHLALNYIELREAAQALSTALEGAFISSWQSTASWDKQKDALAVLLARGK